jgi:shikimate kinase
MKIFLIGMMASGKSSVGKELSKYIELPYLDTDEMIIQSEKKSIKTIFKKKGEKYFRHIESESLKKIKNDGIISCGGGIVLTEENRKYLINNGHTFYLKSSISTLEKRIVNNIDIKRPLIDYGSIKKSLKAIYKKREAFYLECAEDTIITDNKSLIEICKNIKNKLKIEKV